MVSVNIVRVLPYTLKFSSFQLFIIWQRSLSSSSSSFFQSTVVVICCNVTSLFFNFVCKPFTMIEELYQYELCSPHHPDSLLCTSVCIQLMKIYKSKSCIEHFLLWSASVTLCNNNHYCYKWNILQEALCCSWCQRLSCSWCNTNGHQPLLWGGACVRARWQERLQAVNKTES